MKYLKKLLLIITLFSVGASSAGLQSPEDFARETMATSLQKLKAYQMSSDKSKSISKLIRTEFLPKIDQDKATLVVFSKYWKGLNPTEKNVAKNYLLNSMLDDYSAMLGSYRQDSKVLFTVLPKTKRKNNLAIVFASIGTESSKANPIAFKLITNGEAWKIYDVVIMGTSLLKTYKYMIKSKIKRKGLDFVLRKM